MRICLLLPFILAACGNPSRDGNGDGTAAVPTAALALPLIAADPAPNPTTAAKVELGRALFWDPILSGDRDIACATCHHPAFAYADGAPVSVGTGGTRLGPTRQPSPTMPHRTTRNAMTVLDAAFNGLSAGGPADPAAAPMFWDSRAKSLEQQAKGPMSALDEMRGSAFTDATIFPELVARLQAIPEYAQRFGAVFGDTGVTSDTMVEAIAAFERTIVDRDSSFDRYARGDTSALSAAALRGYETFVDHGCAACHSGPMFSDFQLHRLGVPGGDPGSGGGLFRTGSLRNVARTAPYMHNGALATLDDVFRFYDRIDRRLDQNLRGLQAPERGEATDVKAFLGSISDGTFDRTVPTSVPSGLTPGGSIR